MLYSIFDRLMTEAGETPYQVAKATGVAQSTLSDWKTGKSVPRNPTMKKIADHYGVSVSYLKGESTERGETKKPVAADELSEDDMELLRRIKTAPEEKKRAILLLLRDWDNA